MTRSARVVVASTRAARGQYADRTGPVIRAWLVERGFDTPEPIVVPDAEGRWSMTMRLSIDTQLAESRMPQFAEAATV